MDEIFWTKLALRDLEEIGSYIALDSPRSAEQVVRRIVESVAILMYHPKIGHQSRNGKTRRLIVAGTPYVVVYQLRERIEIVTIFHASRKWPDQFA